MDKNYRALAASVINQAVRDLNHPTIYTSPGRAVEAKETAIKFLTEPNTILDFWCSVGDLDPNAIIEGARKLIRNKTQVKIINATHIKIETGEDDK